MRLIQRIQSQPPESRVDILDISAYLNARDAMPRGGRLHLIARPVYLNVPVTDGQAPFRPGLYIEISIVDSGVGIDEDDKAKIFEPFFTTRKTDEGNGLGLTVVRSIANDCGGAVRVQSHLRAGSTFQVYLPVDEGGPYPPTL